MALSMNGIPLFIHCLIILFPISKKIEFWGQLLKPQTNNPQKMEHMTSIGGPTCIGTKAGLLRQG